MLSAIAIRDLRARRGGNLVLPDISLEVRAACVTGLSARAAAARRR